LDIYHKQFCIAVTFDCLTFYDKQKRLGKPIISGRAGVDYGSCNVHLGRWNDSYVGCLLIWVIALIGSIADLTQPKANGAPTGQPGVK